MRTSNTTALGRLAQAWRWLKDQIVREVPLDSAICEFDCRKQQCMHDEWATCERRISRGAGEFMPEQPEAPKSSEPS